MYLKDQNGNRVNVKLNYPEPVEYYAPAKTHASTPTDDKPEGSNKTMLYVTLIIGLIVVAGSGFLIYRNVKKNKHSKLGYEIA